MGSEAVSVDGGKQYQCPACGAGFRDIFSGLEHTDRVAGNVPLRRID